MKREDIGGIVVCVLVLLLTCWACAGCAGTEFYVGMRDHGATAIDKKEVSVKK